MFILNIFKGIVQTKVKILSLFTHYHVVTNPAAFLSFHHYWSTGSLSKKCQHNLIFYTSHILKVGWLKHSMIAEIFSRKMVLICYIVISVDIQRFIRHSDFFFFTGAPARGTSKKGLTFANLWLTYFCTSQYCIYTYVKNVSNKIPLTFIVC